MPRKITASTAAWPATSSRTAGTVSRVSDPARSIGLLRLQRGGRIRVDRGAEVVGQRHEGELGPADGVRRRHAPTADGGDAPRPTGPPGAAASRTSPRPRTPPRRWRPARPRPVGTCPRTPGRRWRASRCATPRRGSPRRSCPPAARTSGWRVVVRAGLLVERAAVAHRLDVREAHGGRGIVGQVLEVVGDGERRRVARRDRPAHAHVALDREVEEARHEVARLARRCRSGPPVGRARRSARRAPTGVDTMPWPLGPARSIPSSSASDTSSSWARTPAAPASPYPAVATNAARTPFRAHAGGARGSRPAACTRTRDRRRRRGGRRPRSPPGARAPRRLRGSRGAPGPRSRSAGCCGASRTRTCPGAPTRRRR